MSSTHPVNSTNSVNSEYSINSTHEINKIDISDSEESDDQLEKYEEYSNPFTHLKEHMSESEMIMKLNMITNDEVNDVITKNFNKLKNNLANGVVQKDLDNMSNAIAKTIKEEKKLKTGKLGTIDVVSLVLKNLVNDSEEEENDYQKMNKMKGIKDIKNTKNLGEYISKHKYKTMDPNKDGYKHDIEEAISDSEEELSESNVEKYNIQNSSDGDSENEFTDPEDNYIDPFSLNNPDNSNCVSAPMGENGIQDFHDPVHSSPVIGSELTNPPNYNSYGYGPPFGEFSNMKSTKLMHFGKASTMAFNEENNPTVPKPKPKPKPKSQSNPVSLPSGLTININSPIITSMNPPAPPKKNSDGSGVNNLTPSEKSNHLPKLDEYLSSDEENHNYSSKKYDPWVEELSSDEEEQCAPKYTPNSDNHINEYLETDDESE